MKISRQLRLRIDQVYVLIVKDFKLKYNATALGFLWSLLVPAFTSIVYYFVFGVMMRWDAKNYLLYLMSGTFLWQFFSNVIMMNGCVLAGNIGLLKKTSFDRGLLISGTFCAEAIHFLLTIPILLGMMAFYGVGVAWISIVPNLVVCIVALYFLSVGISYAYAACNLYFRDLERIMNIVLLMWMFCSPVFIPVSNVPEKYHWIYDCNPAAAIMNIWRDIFYEPAFNPHNYIVVLGISMAAFFLGRQIFRKMEPGFAEMM